MQLPHRALPPRAVEVPIAATEMLTTADSQDLQIASQDHRLQIAADARPFRAILRARAS